MIPLDDISAAAADVRSWLANRKPELAIVLGSGLSALLTDLENPIALDYQQLPGFPAAGVSGHLGKLHCGELYGQSVLIFQGRYHVYEGYTAWQVSAPIRLAAAVGCGKLLLTNAAGGISSELQPGDFMFIDDHLNLTGQSPLVGCDELEFVDLTQVYQRSLYLPLQEQLRRCGLSLPRGVVAWMLGPNYETPAEVKALALLGADAVSMSTVPEAIVGKRYQLETIAISFIANLAAGQAATLDHQDVLASGHQAGPNLRKIISELISLWFA